MMYTNSFYDNENYTATGEGQFDEVDNQNLIPKLKLWKSKLWRFS